MKKIEDIPKEYLENYLELHTNQLMKRNIITVMIWMDLIMIPLLVFGYYERFSFSFWLAIIPLNIWAICLKIKKQKQKIYFLYIGITCIVLSLMHLILSFKLSAQISWISKGKFTIVTVIIYLLVLILPTFANKIFLEKGIYYRLKNNQSKKTVVIVIFSALGVFAARVISNFLSYEYKVFVCVICMLIICYILELGIHNIYKYYLLRKTEGYIILKCIDEPLDKKVRDKATKSSTLKNKSKSKK